MQANIPFFDSSDKQFEQMYYFRWYAWQKHLVSTPHGYLITEWLPKQDLPDFGALPDAAPFHLGEARWLRNPQIATNYARYWTSPEADPRKYSFPLADSVRNVTLATGNTTLGPDLLPALIANYRAWESIHQDSNGLYWQIDTLPMKLQISAISERLIICGDWQFDKATGAEIDDELGWGPPPLMTGSYLDPSKTEYATP